MEIQLNTSELDSLQAYAKANQLEVDEAAKALILLALSGNDRTTALEAKVVQVSAMIDELRRQFRSIKEPEQPTLDQIKQEYNLKPASQIQPKKQKISASAVDWSEITIAQLEQQYADFWNYMISRAEARNAKLKKPETEKQKIIDFAFQKCKESGAKFYKDWQDDLKIIAMRNPDFLLKWSPEYQTFQQVVSVSDEPVDMSTDITQVKVYMEFLNLVWDSPNIKAWVDMAKAIHPFEWDSSKGSQGLPEWVILKLANDLNIAVGGNNANHK